MPLTGLFPGQPLLPADLLLLLKSYPTPVEAQQHYHPDRYGTVREDRQEIVRSIVSLAQCLVQVAVCGPEHEERRAEPGREPKRPVDPDAQEAEEAPCPIMKPDLQLERGSRRPADERCRVIGKEDMRNGRPMTPTSSTSP